MMLDILLFSAVAVAMPGVDASAMCLSANNPCDSNNHNIWDDPTRNVNHPFTSQAEDSQLMEGWYRGIEPAGVDMSTKVLSPLTCQSYSPIWLNGTVPNVEDGIVQRPACVQKVLDSNKCVEILQICVKNCGDFNTYFLARPTGTFGRYCFVSGATTLSPADSTSQTTTTTFQPTTTTLQPTKTTSEPTKSYFEATTRPNRPAVRSTVGTENTGDMKIIIIAVLTLVTVSAVCAGIVGCVFYTKKSKKNGLVADWDTEYTEIPIKAVMSQSSLQDAHKKY